MMGAHVHMLAQLSDLKQSEMLGDQLREIQLVLLVTYWVLYYSLARILCYSSYSYTQILDSNNGTL